MNQPKQNEYRSVKFETRVEEKQEGDREGVQHLTHDDAGIAVDIDLHTKQRGDQTALTEQLYKTHTV